MHRLATRHSLRHTRRRRTHA